jgi:RNA polymerase sigma-70 factor (ECF subfamily)
MSALSPDDNEDKQWVEQILAGRAQGLEPLFKKYRERIYRICYRVVFNKEDALDLTQETFLKALRAINTFKKESRFYTWLCQIAVNASIDFLRKRNRRQSVAYDEVVFDESKLSNALSRNTLQPLRNLEIKEIGRLVAEAMNALSEDHRAVFSLFALGDMSYKEIAEVAGCPEGTVMSRLFYARRKLQDALRQYMDAK